MDELKGGNGTEGTFERSVDLRTAAAFLGIHYKTLERMARLGQVPAMKPGNSWQFLLSLLSEWRKEEMNFNLKKNREQKKIQDKKES